MQVPIDTATGRQSESAPHRGIAPVLVGWIVTLPGGHQVWMGLNKGRAERYAEQQGAHAEAVFAFRPEGAADIPAEQQDDLTAALALIRTQLDRIEGARR